MLGGWEWREGGRQAEALGKPQDTWNRGWLGCSTRGDGTRRESSPRRKLKREARRRNGFPCSIYIYFRVPTTYALTPGLPLLADPPRNFSKSQEKYNVESCFFNIDSL